MSHDLVIIGGGPAGLTAGIYGARAGLQTVIIEMAMPGGHAATTHYIENYPGFPDGVGGIELAEKIKQQVLRFGVEIIGSEVKAISKKNGDFVVETDSRQFSAPAAIIAIGTNWRKLDVPGESELRGRGVSYCATCDGPLFKTRDVAVIGCGNSGLQEGKFLLQFVNRVTFVEFLPDVTADKILYDRLKGEERVDFLTNQEVLSIDGTQRVESITVRDRGTGMQQTIPVSGIFIYVGLEPNTGMLSDIVDLDEKGFVIVDARMRTREPGLFAAGDICSKAIRQVVTACAEGATAAISAYHYLETMK
ncbi:MAG: thioredoxin-disulfide reductase [candidate division WOR-3 bacterium]|nr:MAG: thioredoxin-disulfide reductase [candidate division WOR-3 bacterium]